ncbi:hypothetical protein PG993_014774 [Apiospora rasikravindrae]|uniref:Major facilitator superfamily (MFS) profile domain-containing protein n=1 Tax=Apiospora rasikravindrae TaxID=990691 RepID=A0ABR1RNS1_9PEZI
MTAKTRIAKLPDTSLWANRRCLLICIVVSLANMQYGLDSAIVGSLQAMPGFLKVFGYEDPSAVATKGYAIGGTFQRLIGSLLTLGAFLSSLCAGAFAHYWGRRYALWAACALNAVACIIQVASSDKAAVYVGRLALGIANGFLVTFSNIYTAEVAPFQLRAVFVALFSEWVNVGSIIGAAVANATKGRLDKGSYQIPLGTLFIVPVFLTIGLFFVPESSRYLVYKGDLKAGRASLEALRGTSLQTEELELEWAEMVEGIEEEKRIAQTIGPLDMFRGSDRRRTLLCLGILATQAGSGSWFMISYATYFMVVAGLTVDEAFKFSVMNTCLGFIGVNLGIYAMRRLCGRRAILMFGAVVQALAMLGMAVGPTTAMAQSNQDAVRGSVIAFTGLYMFAYNAFVGNASYPAATEMVSTRLRAWTVGSATSLGYLLAWLTGFCSPYFINPENLNWGAKYAYIWAASNLFCLVFFYLCVPETKNRTLEEIDELFANQVSVRNFKKYETTILDKAMRTVQEQHKPEGVVTEHVDNATLKTG